MKDDALRGAVEEIAREAGAGAIAVAIHDFRDATTWHMEGERWFHAASTIKVPVLLGVFDAIEQGRFDARSRLHVRNRFFSEVEGRVYRVPAGRDANAKVHEALGRTMPIGELAEHMIVTSSNLATNLLLDIAGVPQIQATLQRLELHGIELRRGVEDEAAWEKGINNRITALGLCHALRLIEERGAISAQASEAMLQILHRQQFRSGIPAGLPDDARVAHKTGDMSTAAHDAGIVYLENRAPYALAILTEWSPDVDGRRSVIARVSRAVYDRVTEEE